MKKNNILYILVLALVFISMSFCTSVRYTNPIFTEKTQDHRIIAVIPFEMIFTGKQPKKLPPQQIDKIEEVESIAFQNSLYHLLSQQQRRLHHPLRIDIQPVQKTNRILDQQGISIRDSWYMDSRELAHILRVDAVVRTTIEKKRYMSGLASFSHSSQSHQTYKSRMLSPQWQGWAPTLGHGHQRFC
jgi:hypothetical protein